MSTALRRTVAGPPVPVNVGLPTAAAIVVGLLAGLAQVLNETVLSFGATWHAYVSILLVFVAGIGVSPLVGPAFRAALHLPPWAGYLVSAGMAAATLALTTAGVGEAAHAVIAAALTILAALGFAPAPVFVPPAPVPPAPVK